MTRQRTLLAALIASTLALTAGAAMARPGDYGPHCDTNGDGKISREEAQTMPRLAQEFDRLDTNKDGFLTRDELPRGYFRPYHGKRGGGWASLDVNGDGKISRDEARARPYLSQNFDRLDTNKDGFLTRDEMPRGHYRGQGGHYSGPGNHFRGQGGGFNRLDTDGDGRISREEAKANPQLGQNFDLIDANKDGYIDRSEMFRHMADQRFTWLDADKDGKISRDEARQAPRLAQWFDQIDTNKDGFLSRDEFMQHHNQAGMMPHRGGPAGQPPVQDNGLPFSGL